MRPGTTGIGLLAVAVLALAGYGQDAASLVAAGDDCARQQDYRGALARYAEALGVVTQEEVRVDLHRRIARTHLAGEDAAAARAEYAKIVALPGVTPDQKAAAHLASAGTYAADQRVAARAELAKGLAVKEVSAPVRVDLLNRSAELYAREKKHEEYRNELARIVAVKGVRAEQKVAALQRLGRSCHQAGLTNDARVEYGKILADDGMSPDQKATACIWIAETYPDRERAEARTELARGLALENLSPSVRMELLSRIGTSWMQDGNAEEARATFGRILTIKGVSPDQKANAHIWLANTYPVAQYTEARAELIRAVAITGLSPNMQASLQQRLGASFAAEGKLPEARAEFGRIFANDKLTPDQRAKACIWSVSTYPADQRAGARAELARALALEGLSVAMQADLHNRICQAYVADEMLPEAREEARKVLGLKEAPVFYRAQAEKVLELK